MNLVGMALNERFSIWSLYRRLSIVDYKLELVRSLRS